MAATPPSGTSPSALTQAADTADKITKILDLVVKVGGGVAIVVNAAHYWLGDRIAAISPAISWGAIAALMSLTCLSWGAAYITRSTWPRGWWVLTTAGGLGLGLAAMLWAAQPPRPKWLRVDAPLVVASQGPQDLALVVLRDELSGAKGLVAGPPTYGPLLAEKRGDDTMSEPWAAYYAPLLTSGTLPARVSLRETGALNTQNASLGVAVVTWTTDDDGPHVTRPQYRGYSSLAGSVRVDVAVAASERAAMIVFIYPWTAAASTAFPDRLEDVVDVQ